ncbi:dihydrolipoamide acetyltransferase [Buchnera aphidicola (Rhopalosiphum maidis)]|uniref:Dihydrolipoamide acetyltransferase component of pyruvate dehydrogenase complex n=2 Tax=Buchnera aphidicola TaxID=9 RepID=A0A3G2I6I9_BUCRM|nr:dihydrolipoamide acetyltransferase [Buchnera aphidicola (Rhopalosiphum maidis)]
MPDIGLDEVEVTEILVKIGEEIKLDQALITVEGDKASMEIPSPTSGVVKDIVIKVGEKVTTLSTIMVFKIDNVNRIKNKKELNVIKQEKKSSENFLEERNIKKNMLVHATPIIRRLARHLSIDLKNIKPSGPKNRILKEDIELYIKNNTINKNFFDIEKNNIKNSHKPSFKEISLTNIQKIVGKNLHQNWVNIPHVTQFDEVDITLLEEFRQKYNSQKKQKNNIISNITILPFIIKTVACALLEFPIFNSSLSSNKKTILLKNYVNVGIAVDSERGLFVPVLKDVDKKNISRLSSELILLSKKARENQLNELDMKEGCFTISNLGGIGGSWFSPIINAPEVAILGVSKSSIKPLWNGKEFIPSLMLPLSLSYDHRVINGADAARFLTFIGKLLSDIRFLIM